jgi:uncharacterized protein (TIGR01777 family)
MGITGATGFVGRALVAEAVARGHEVVAFSRGSQVSIPGVNEVRVMVSEGDVEVDLSALDALVHLAGENVFGVWTEAKKRRIYDSRVDWTRRMAAAVRSAESHHLKVLVSASGSGAYGDRGDELLTEMSAAGKGFLAEVCRDWEAAAMSAQSDKTRVVLLRTGMVLGKEGGVGRWPSVGAVDSYRRRGGDDFACAGDPSLHRSDESGITQSGDE